jgi:hypothetical protein
MHRTTFSAAVIVLALIGLTGTPASAQLMSKAQVANLIAKVENGVDQFRDYLEKRGDNAKDASSAAESSGRKKRGGATENQKAKASSKTDALDDALGDLNRSTNRLRRKFDPTDKWMETKGQVEKVVDDARKINQVVARGSYGPEAARLWAVLRTGINDLARAYGVAPLGV